MRCARIGLWFNRHAADNMRARGWNVFSGYIEEVLQHRGIPYAVMESLEQCTKERFDIVIAACVDETGDDADVALRYAESGGLVIALAGLNRIAAKLGGRAVRGAAHDYAAVSDADEPLGPGPVRLRFAESAPWAVDDRSRLVAAYGRVPNGALLLRFRTGAGRIDRFAVNVSDTIVKLQQGDRPVFEDGIPAPDGTGAVDDGVLKADDVTMMDWETDRLRTASGIPYFAYPYADQWRELFVGYVVRSAWELGLSVPFLGYWPNGVKCVAHLSHDSDFNEDEHARTTLDLLREQGIRSTWCMLEPGYSRGVYDRVAAEGHELAFHYNAVHADQGVWGEAEFRRQLQWLKQAIGRDDIVTNKNHLTRMEGWGELFQWCERAGIQSDQSRGPSKRGNVGFLFGTCHPYFPAAWADERNRRYDVLQIGFLTPDMNTGKWSDDRLIEPLLQQVARTEGVAHFLFHQIHLHQKEEVRYAYRRWCEEVRNRGFAIMTNREINDWERSRRLVRIVASDAAGGRPQVHKGGAQPGGFVVWMPVRAESGSGLRDGTVQQYGVPCVRVVVN